ncbi:MAG TPA: hypothetical protein VF634_03490, partial [Pyrinomonadaceae bacterium]
MSKELMSEAGETKRGTNETAARREQDGAATSDRARAATSHGGRAASGAATRTPAGDAPDLNPPVLSREAEARGKVLYHVEELLQYHDRHFIENAYNALLGRAPSDAERARELDELRGVRASKVEIVERLASLPEAVRRGVRVEGLPSPLMRRLSGVPVVGYLLRLARALVRLPLLMEHQQQFEIYTVAQQQLITDHFNQLFALSAQGYAVGGGSGEAAPAGQAVQVSGLSSQGELLAAVAMFSDALLDLSNGHAELQAHVETQAGQVQAALTDLTGALTAQQQITETLRHVADAQQEFLIQEQRVIVETQQVVLEELRRELRELSERQQRARAEFDAEARRLR